MRRDRGFALILVLWSLVLLALITSRLVAGGRAEAVLASNLRAAAAAEMLADAAVHEAAFRLLDGSRPGGAGEPPRRLVLAGGSVLLGVIDQAGLVNPNSVSEAVLRAVLSGAGAGADQARSVAAAIVDWRTQGSLAQPYGAKAPDYRAAGLGYGPPGAPFRSVQDLGLVLGMTPALQSRLAPHLTVFYEGDPDPGLAAPLVLAALQAVSGPSPPGGGPRTGARVVQVLADATGTEGGHFVRRAVLRVGAGSGGLPYQVLEWRRGGE